MNWKAFVMAPVALLGLAVVGGIATFAYRVGETWDQGQTNTLVNGLVMVCWGSGMFGVFIVAILIGAAMATRIMGTPNRSGGNGSGAGGRGWGRHDDPVLDDLNRGGKVIDVYPSVPGARPMLPGPGASAGTPITYQPRASGAFDGMDDGDDSRFGQLRG